MAKAKNTYTWNCRTVDCYPTFEDNADVVYNVHWRLNCTSDKVDAEGNPYVASVYGTQAISTEDIKDFIPFADLDNANIPDSFKTGEIMEKARRNDEIFGAIDMEKRVIKP